MYLLDTMVVSELRRLKSGRADPRVAEWIGRIPAALFHLSALSVAEIERGVLLVLRRDPGQGAVLRGWLEGAVLPAFAGRILPVDVAVARRAAALQVPDPRPLADCLIAATALEHGLTVVTRNAGDFAPMGVPHLNPWQPQDPP